MLIVLAHDAHRPCSQRPTKIVRHPSQSGWLDKWDRLKGGHLLSLGVALKRAFVSIVKYNNMAFTQHTHGNPGTTAVPTTYAHPTTNGVITESQTSPSQF